MNSSMPSSPKTLALDYGDARIGVARSDDLGLMAHPVETVVAQPRESALARIAQLFSDSSAQRLVIGLPVREDGTEGSAAVKIRKFVELLAKKLPPGTPVHFHDEYRSTEVAKSQLRAAGRKEKHHKPMIDQAAAVVILQEFLDWENLRSKVAEDDLGRI